MICGWFCLWFEKVVTPDVEHAIQTRAIIFPGELGAELEELLFGEFLAQARVEVVGDV